MGTAVCTCNFKQEQQEESFFKKIESNDVNVNSYSSKPPQIIAIDQLKSNKEVECIVDQKQSRIMSLRQSKLYNEQVFKYNLRISGHSFIMLCRIQYLFRQKVKIKNQRKNEHSSFTNDHNNNIQNIKGQSNDESNIAFFRIRQISFTNLSQVFGIKIWKDGAKYIGEFKDDSSTLNFNKSNAIISVKDETYELKAHGLGIFSHYEGDEYRGEFRNDETNGFGVYNHLNGASYEGFWYQDSQNGAGIEYWSDGSTFEGFYRNGSKEGIGVYSWADGSEYMGQWKNNNLEGYGIYKFADGRIYSGEWLENSMHGYGEFEWQDGKKYKGFYEYDQKSGFGMYLWTNPIRIYIGFWKEGKQGGIGRYIYNKGSNWGVWESGEKTGKLESKDEAYSLLNSDEKKYFTLMEKDVSFIYDILKSG